MASAWPDRLPDPRRLLAELGRRPNKRLGQNFLVNASLTRRIAESIAELEPDIVVEVGPGLGHLTEGLLDTTDARIEAVELDPALAAHLERWFARAERVRIQRGDAREIDWSRFEGSGKVLAVGNLPFWSATEILVSSMVEPRVAGGVFMVQREVAERIVSPPGRKSYGALSVVCQLAAEVEVLFRVRPGSFFPAPEVEGAVVRWVGAPGRDRQRLEQVHRILRDLFARRRKTLANALRGLGLTQGEVAADPVLAELTAHARRPEELPPSQLLNLATRVAALRETGRGDS